MIEITITKRGGGPLAACSNGVKLFYFGYQKSIDKWFFVDKGMEKIHYSVGRKFNYWYFYNFCRAVSFIKLDTILTDECKIISGGSYLK
jgi:hypothetical protein